MNPETHDTAEPPPSPLYEIHIAQVAAMSDAWALDPYPPPGIATQRANRLVFVSLIGPATTMKGIRASLQVTAELPEATLLPYRPGHPDDRTLRNITLHSLRNSRSWQTRIPSLTRQHQLMIVANDPPQPQPPDDDNSDSQNFAKDETFYIFAEDPADGPKAFYRQFAKRSPTPTLPEWAPFIWDLAVDENSVRPLTAWGIHGWRCDLNYPQMESQITQMVGEGALPVPTP